MPKPRIKVVCEFHLRHVPSGRELRVSGTTKDHPLTPLEGFTKKTFTWAAHEAAIVARIFDGAGPDLFDRVKVNFHRINL